MNDAIAMTAFFEQAVPCQQRSPIAPRNIASPGYAGSK